jgi:EipB-like
MAWRRRPVIAGALGALLAALPAAAAPPPASALQPHRAFYRLELAQTRGVDPLQGVEGGLVIEWRLACDGWLSRQRLGFVAAAEGGVGLSRDVRFSSWEAADGSSLRYTVRSFQGEALEEEFRGEAQVEKQEGGVASFTRPKEVEVRLPGGTVFPTEHLERVLLGAGRGERLMTHEVFDGWGFDSLTQITTAIGEPRPLPASAGRRAGERAWPISMAYYKIDQQSDVPEFEASFLLSADGVMREISLDYGDFMLHARLEQLDLRGRPGC